MRACVFVSLCIGCVVLGLTLRQVPHAHQALAAARPPAEGTGTAAGVCFCVGMWTCACTRACASLTLQLEPHAHRARWQLLGLRQRALAQQRVCEVRALLAVTGARALLRHPLVVPMGPTRARSAQCQNR